MKLTRTRSMCPLNREKIKINLNRNKGRCARKKNYADRVENTVQYYCWNTDKKDYIKR